MVVKVRKGYKIGLFFIVLVIGVLIGLVVWRRCIWNEHLQENDTEQQKQMVVEGETQNDAVLSAQDSNIRTTCDTVFLYEDMDKKDGTIVLTEEKIPGKYIDMTRSELEVALMDDSKQLSLEDKKRGFESQHLELFSGEKVKIVRIFDTTQEKEGYYLLAVGQEIWVYKQDKETLYFKTDLILDDLPEMLREEVVEGKFMDSEIAVYNFSADKSIGLFF